MNSNEYQVEVYKSAFFDASRDRLIPVAFYLPQSKTKIANQKIVIFSHGYGENKGGDYLLYSYLTENLASKGYFVASIQHELPTDSLLAMKGEFKITRRPNWERGAENILFVIKELKKSNPDLDFDNLILIGHSNGGDMTALFGEDYPDLVSKMILLDNRRMAIPRTNKIKILTLRSTELPADDGVLPTEIEQVEYGTKIIKLPNTKHGEMDNDANKKQRQEINNYIELFLKN